MTLTDEQQKKAVELLKSMTDDLVKVKEEISKIQEKKTKLLTAES